MALALAVGDHAGLDQLETRVLRRLPTSHHAPLDWVADQLGMARLGLARRDLGGPEPVALNLILAEAEGVAMEMGAPALAARATQIRCEAGR